MKGRAKLESQLKLWQYKQPYTEVRHGLLERIVRHAHRQQR